MPLLTPEAALTLPDPTLVIFPAAVGVEVKEDAYRLELTGDLDDIRALLVAALAAVEGHR